MEFSRPEYWSGYTFPSPGDLPNPGMEPRFPALQADSLPAEPSGKPMKLIQTIFVTLRKMRKKNYIKNYQLMKLTRHSNY